MCDRPSLLPVRYALRPARGDSKNICRKAEVIPMKLFTPICRAAFTAFMLTAVGSTFQPAAADSRPDIVIAVNKLPRGLEPAVYTGNVDVRGTYSIFDTLIRRDFLNPGPNGAAALIPGLAASWKRTGPTTLELELRKGVKFHNGEEFTADDVVFTFSEERLRGKNAAIPAGRGYFGHVAKVEKIDPYKVRFVTKNPDLVLEHRLSSYTSWIVSKQEYESHKAKGAEAVKAAAGGKAKDAPQSWLDIAVKEETWSPVGTGPYRFKDWKSDDYVRLVANDNYFMGQPAAKSVTFKQVPEVSARIAGLVSGEFDIVVEIPPDQIPVVEGYKDLTTKSVVLENSHLVVFNTSQPQLKDKRVRQALSLAIDRKKLVDTLWHGKTYTPNGHQLASFGPTYDKSRVGYRYDPAAAKKLLKEGGYTGEPVSFRIIPDYYTNGMEAAQIIQEMWKAVGFNMQLDPVENWKAVRDDGLAIFPWSNTYRYPDPSGAIYILWGPDSSVQRKFKYWEAPAAFNDAMKTVLESADQEERAAALKKALDAFEDEMPATILYNPLSTYSMRKGIDWTPYPIYYMDLRPDNLKIKKEG
jgi:peptide/nickel transport system substrate-binding protein